MAKKEADKKLEIKVIVDKLKHLKSDRGNWEREWQDVADYVLPRKNEVITKRTDGERKTTLIFDNTAIVSNELLAGFLHGMLTSPNTPWFEFTTGDAALDREDEVRAYLQESARRVHNVLANSNFNTEVHEMYLDLGAFNTACMFVEEVKPDEGREVVRFSTKFIANYYIDEDHLGRVNQVYQEWKWDAGKIVHAFGIDNVPAKIKDCYEKNKTEEYTVIHAMYPEHLIPNYSKSNKPWVSHYILPDLNAHVKIDYFFEIPCVIPRWAKASGEKYGRGPGMAAIPEVKSLNKMAEVVLKGAQKVVDPPLMVPDDGFIMPIRTKPASLNYYRAGTTDTIRPIFNNTQVDFGFQVMQEKRLRVREAFYIDQLISPTGGPARTATEVMQRAEEQMRLMGPILGRQQSEFARPLVDRVFGIMERRNLLPLAPEVLQGRIVDVRYTSPIAKTQRLAEGNAIMRTVQAMAPFVQTDPTILDNINGDAILKVVADIYGFPQEGFKTKREVQETRQARAQQQQMAMAQQQRAQQSEEMYEQADAAAKLMGAQSE